ncbi:uncharacterized protein LOC126738753 [Anthonomus grandis grandis]|uniref:uncharacterized protein LOC126738753 n=1 Tax=Anthonomus grandis grandis TaxID=2921223 RepID=UPI002166647B|nr:uncharacterized protein LOC126738753 [Anthonomus grandis grandis]
MSQRKASETYNIPRSTIISKLKAIKNNFINPPGRKCVFTKEEEQYFVQHCIVMCECGFPVTPFDLRCIIKMYLDSTGRNESRFQNNFPEKRWMEGFLLRRKGDLSKRLCSNIKRCRAAVDDQITNKYFDHLEAEVQGVPPTAIFNYDETNLVDDPGKKTVLSKRDCKYPEQIKNSTKAAVSIMMCGNAAGELCPPYVNYKAEKMWDTWTEGGPAGTRYNRSKSGWFDGSSFEDWFMSILLPKIKRSRFEKSVMIGDNLSSHISPKAIKLCEEHNIAFIALPPNSTHLTQPLDISFLRPFKINWRKVLDEWKSSSAGRRHPTVPKDVFPSLLNELFGRTKENAATNLQSGFRKAGIYPFTRDQVLARLPSSNRVNESSDYDLINKSFTAFLENVRKSETVPRIIRKKKKLNVEPGKSIGPDDINESSTSGIKKKKKSKQLN